MFSFSSAGAGDGVAQTGSWRREEEEGGLGKETAGRDKPPTETSGERGESQGKRQRDKWTLKINLTAFNAIQNSDYGCTDLKHNLL